MHSCANHSITFLEKLLAALNVCAFQQFFSGSGLGGKEYSESLNLVYSGFSSPISGCHIANLKMPVLFPSHPPPCSSQVLSSGGTEARDIKYVEWVRDYWKRAFVRTDHLLRSALISSD